MNSTSWGETISHTMREKLPNQSAPPTEQLLYNRSNSITRSKGYGQGTVFHPITGVWTAPERERAAVEVRARDAVERGNYARDRQLKHMQSFDIFTGRPYVDEPPLPPGRRTTESFSSRVPFNILTSQPLPDLLLTTRAANPRLAARAQGEPARPLYNHAPTLVRRRAIDPLSGKYVEDNEGKSAAEAGAARERATRRFWQTRNFDPLLQRYEDPAKDAAYEEGVRASEAVQGVAQAARLPPSTRYSLGRAYDPVGHRAVDAGVLDLLDTMENRPLRRLNRLGVEERLGREGEEEAELARLRRQNTQRSARAMDNHDPRGFTLTNALPTTYRDTLTGAPLTAWDRISRDLEAGGGWGGPGGEGGGRGGGGGGGGGGGAGGGGDTSFTSTTSSSSFSSYAPSGGGGEGGGVTRGRSRLLQPLPTSSANTVLFQGPPPTPIRRPVEDNT